MGAWGVALLVALSSCLIMVLIQSYATEEVLDFISSCCSGYLPAPVTSVLLSFKLTVIDSLSEIWNGLVPSILLLFNHGSIKQELLLTKGELQSFKYKYLAIAGEVFDVADTEKGIRHYGKDGHYNFFTGVDGSKAFVTGDFTEEGLIDDITELDSSGIRSIEDWRLMYHKEYKYIGKVIGRFYDANGEETEQKIKYKKLLEEAEKKKIATEEFNKLYPPCNSEFKHKASRVWCSNRSGGIERAWSGVPRKLFKVGSAQFRCACVRTTGPPSSDPDSTTHSNRGDLDNPNLREYDNCEPSSASCKL